MAPTDARNRPDQRLMEETKWDEANREKVRLEDKQRETRKRRAAEGKTSETTTVTSPGKNENNFLKLEMNSCKKLNCV